MKRFGWLALFLAVVACGGAPAPAPAPAAQAEGSGAAVATDASYVAAIEKHRAQRVARLRDPNGWLSVSGLFWLSPGDNAFGSDPAGEIVLPADAAPERAGIFRYQDGEVFLLPYEGGGVTVNGEPARSTPLTEEDELGLGRLKIRVIDRSGRHAARVRDPQNPALTAFEGIDFYPVDERYKTEGRLIPYDEPRAFSVDTVIGTPAELVTRGEVEFELFGTTFRLEALANSEDAQELFLMFTDRTSGQTTYPAGRYLYAPFVGERVDLDFNKAYNPPCAFTHHATCPLPPPENAIDIALEAGERAYHLD